MTAELKKLKILNWNAHGISSQRNEFKIFLESNFIDIACITETHLSQNITFRIPGYKILRKDRECSTASGGVALIIKNNISFTENIIDNILNIEVISVRLHSFPSTVVTAVYKPPNKKLLQDEILKLLPSGDHSLVLGDMNSKNIYWGCRKSNSSGNILLEICSRHNIQIHTPNEPTFYRPGCNPDILDIALTKNCRLPLSSHVITALNSDHIPVLINFSTELNVVPKRKSLINGTIDWELYKILVAEKINLKNNFSTALEIEENINKLNESISNSLQEATVRPFQLVRKNFSRSCPKSILLKIKEKNHARRQWMRNRDPTYKKTWNHLKHVIKKELDEWVYSKYQNYVKDLDPKDQSLWKATRRVLSKFEKIPSLEENGGYIISDAEKAEAFADYFEKTFSNPECERSPHSPNVDVEDYLKLPLTTVQLPIKFTTPKEIQELIRSLKVKKSPGHDLIPVIALKNFPRKALVYITSIFNSCLRTGYFPETWKKAELVVIHKHGKNAKQVSSYRPISLLPIVGKLLESVIKRHLASFLQCNSIIPDFQFGFQYSHSTSHQLARLSEFIVNGFEMKKHTLVTFLDFQQAFDKVWHCGLLYKLKKVDTPKYLYDVLSSFLNGRTFTVRINNINSTLRQIHAGTPQGSVLSPILFNFYVHDIIQSTNTSIAMFADDTAVFSQHNDILIARNTLQSYLVNLEQYLKKWMICLNTEKCTAKIFTLRRPSDPPELILKNKELKWNPASEAVKYLGVYLDRRLTWNYHINNKLTQTYARLAMLYPIVNRKSSLKPETTVLIHKTILRPLLMYGCEVWGAASATKRKKLQSFQNKVLRIAVDAPWFIRNAQLHRELKLETIDEFIKKRFKKFHTQLPAVKGAVAYNLGNPTSSRRLKPRLIQDIML